MQGKQNKLFVPVKVDNEPVEVVSNFKYLGTLTDNKLSFSDNSDLTYKKSQQRLYLLQKLIFFFLLVVSCYKLCTKV